MDIFLPPDATLHTRVGERVVAGISRVAELASRPATRESLTAAATETV
jgi:hypothetical protein